ncbi:hypothetical protein T440DRAFT_551835 [Plenodomus tracheiphilus IPT5]|uniref:Apple domain-containing protein n=1 Tax=Plenodomus tracheiphilus IPT5 TaxID=1408161 RepID=A0A6A7BGX1_9PLEO|nr:hypothetical protein T440DRAFT_551835 [Plenodomus tracheiphilus IPT5]
MQFFTTAVSSLLFLGAVALPSTPHPTFCGIRGYDYLNKPYDVQQDSRIRTLAECKSECLATTRCNSYAVGKGACVLFDYDTLGTFVPYEGSHYLFYDRACDQDPTPDPEPTPTPDPDPVPVPVTCVPGGKVTFTCGSDIEVLGYIQILDPNTNQVLGYVNNNLSPRYMFKKDLLASALVVKAKYSAPDCTDPSGIALELQNLEPNDINPGYIGSAGSWELSDNSEIYGYSMTTSVSYVPPNVPGENGQSGFNTNPVQASIWTLDMSCGYITSTLINPDGSKS